MVSLVPPHGGRLVQLLIHGNEKKEELKEALGLQKVVVNSKEFSDLIMLGIGAFSPLEGFSGRNDYESVLKAMRLESGLLWPIPITLSISRERALGIKEGEKIALYGPDDETLLATMLVKEKFAYDKRREALRVFNTDDARHPGVEKVYEQGEIYIGGPVKVLSEGSYPKRFSDYARPEETRELFKARGWEKIAAFQTRNPMHRSHEYLTKIALEVVDGLFIHPIVGRLKEGDIPADVRIRCYMALVDNYYPKERVVIKVYPMEMRYGGPREALLHAIIRQNFGCSHIIVGRDHAGVGNYYGPFDAQKIFDHLEANDLLIEPIKMDWTFYCNRCGQMASPRTCPHPKDDHLIISGTQLREMLSEGKKPSDKFSRPEVLDILQEYYRAKCHRGKDYEKCNFNHD